MEAAGRHAVVVSVLAQRLVTRRRFDLGDWASALRFGGGTVVVIVLKKQSQTW